MHFVMVEYATGSQHYAHYIDVIMTTVASQITSLTVFTQPFIQTQIKENIKAPHYWPLRGEFTGTGEVPAQRASYMENVSIWWRHHDIGLLKCGDQPSTVMMEGDVLEPKSYQAISNHQADSMLIMVLYESYHLIMNHII